MPQFISLLMNIFNEAICECFRAPKAPTVQRIALAAQSTYMSTANVPDVDCLAAMGTHGKDNQNIARDLISMFCAGHDNIMPHPYIVSLPVQVKVHADCEKRVEFRDFRLFFLMSGLLCWMHLITFGGLFFESKT